MCLNKNIFKVCTQIELQRSKFHFTLCVATLKQKIRPSCHATDVFTATLADR